MGKPGSHDASRVTSRLYTLRSLDRGTLIAARIRLAGTSVERRNGLLGVSDMGSDDGLWICPCEAVHTFGMKIPIDVVFLDRQRRVRKIRPNLAANRISFCFEAESVIELRAGVVAGLGIQVNDRLEFKSLKLTACSADDLSEACPRL